MVPAAPAGTAGADDDVVDALTEAHEHLVFARAALSRAGVHDRAGLQRRIDALERRLRDPDLHLAVIGEFSSGKSTLINALLRDPILASDPLPTTRAITRLRQGTRPRVHVRFTGSEAEYTYPAAYGAPRLMPRLRSLRPAGLIPSTMDGLLGLLIADERVAPALAEVTVEHPADVLGAGLVLIDTPGTNAEAGHTDLTQRILADEADAALVVFPADDPLGETLAAFLRTALDAGMLSRCIFVVTRMAHVEEDEQEALLEVVRQRVRRKLGVQDPVLLPVSVGAVVRDLQGRRPRPEERRWVAEFPDTEHALLRLVAHRRPIAVSDRVLGLMHDLLDGLRADLRAEEAILQQDRTTLATSELTDVESFCNSARRSAQADLRKRRATVVARIAKLAEVGSARMVQEVVAAFDGPPAERKDRVETAARNAVARLARECRPVLSGAGEAGIRIVAGIDRAAVAEYAKLTPAGTASTLPAPVPPASLERVGTTALDAVWQMQAAQVSAENRLSGGGAAAGAVVGTMLFPVVGTAIGAILGMGAGLFGAQQREQALRDQVRASATALAAQVRTNAHTDAVKILDGTAKLIDDRIRVHRTHYTPLVRSLVTAHRDRADALARRQTTVAAELAEVERRARLVNERRQRIAATRR